MCKFKLKAIKVEAKFFRLPFAYSLTNEEVKKFHNGPIFANRSCPSCLEGCVKKTGLEVSWQYDEDQGIDNAALYINPSKYLISIKLYIFYFSWYEIALLYS